MKIYEDIFLRCYCRMKIALSVKDKQSGMATAEYAVGIVAAVAFAGVLFKIVTSSAVQSALTDIVVRALKSR